MNRRQFVSTTVLPLVLAGCAEQELGGDAGDTPESCWPRMCAGTALVKVRVDESVSGDVVLEADCREADRDIEPGETGSVERTEEGESCLVRLSIDDDEAYNESIAGYQRTTVTVTASGDIEIETVVL